MENSRIIELQEDIKQLATYKEQSKRPNVRKLIAQAISSLEKQITRAQNDAPKKIIKAEQNKMEPGDKTQGLVNFEMISSFSFDQTDAQMKVYILNLSGVGDLQEEKVSCDFTEHSFDLRILGLNKKNYRLFKKNLFKEVDPSKSKFKCYSNRITIYLSKKEKGNWKNLVQEEEKKPFGNKKDDKEDKDKDPQAALMDMMKEMYQNGDDNMKRTIAESWTKSREKQAAGGDPMV